MMTFTEAKQRVSIANAAIRNTGHGDYRVTLNEWCGKDAEAKAYYTDDLEDAVFTAQTMRRNATRH